MMISTYSETLPIAVIGANDRMRDTIEIFFKGPCRGRYALSREQDALITIADLDAVKGQDLLDSHRRQYPHLPVIALTVRDLDIEDVQLLRKPIQLKALEKALEIFREELQTKAEQEITPDAADSEAIASRRTKPEQSATPVLEEQSITEPSPPGQEPKDILAENHLIPRQAIDPALPKSVNESPRKKPPAADAAPFLRVVGKSTRDSERLIQTCCGHAADIDPTDPNEYSRLFYRPTTFIQGYLERAMEKAHKRDKVVRMVLIGDKNITLLPGSGMVFTDMADRILRPRTLISMRDNEVQISLSPESEEQLLQQKELEPVPYESFLWKVALWSARGRVPEGTDLERGVELLRCPNFTRLITTPYFLQISALWSRSSYSLLDTASTLDIPQRYVLAFFSACQALEMAQIGKKKQPRQEPGIEPAAQQRRQFLSRIARHVRRG
jgi:hypothetical protein